MFGCLTGKPGQRDHEVLLLVRLVALETPLVVALSLSLPSAEKAAYSADQVALDEAAAGSAC